MRGFSPSLLVCAFLVMPPPVLLAQEWPQFRGPDGQGHSAERGLPIEWSESKNIAWKIPVPGRGWSSPVVVDGNVWLTTATQIGRDISLRVMSFNAASGRQALDVEVFRIKNLALLNPKNSHASPTPIVEGDRVYVHFGAQGTAAVSTSGEVVWKAWRCTKRSMAVADRRSCMGIC